jgi:hypothetical protein
MLYECHVTTNYVAPATELYEKLCEIAIMHGFKVARLYKWNKEHSDLDTFMTAHDKSEFPFAIHVKMTELVNSLTENNFTVTRYKIEEILFDSKRGDKL